MKELEEAAREYASCEVSEGGLAGLRGIEAGKMEPFIAGAQWQAKQSPWIKTSEKLPIPTIEMVDGEEYGSVFVIGRSSKYKSPDLHSYFGYNGNYEWEDGRIPEYWMPIPLLTKSLNPTKTC